MVSGAIGSLASVTRPDPNIDIAEAFKQIEAQRQAQLGAVQNFGQTQDKNLQSDYTGLQQSLTSSIGAQKANYDTGAQNIANTYKNAGAIGDATSAQVQGGVREMAQRMGLDDKALQSVQGNLATQAAAFGQRNAASEAGRISSMQELGSKMGAVQQLGIQTAQKAEAQGRSDLSKRLITEVQRVQTAAQQSQADFTGVKSQQLAKQTMQLQATVRQATAQMMSEQRQARSQALSEQRMAMSQGNSDRMYNLSLQRLADSQGKMTPLQNFEAQQQYLQQNPRLTAANQDGQAIYDKAKRDYGPYAMHAINQMLAGMSPADIIKSSNNPKAKGNMNDWVATVGELRATRFLG